MNMLVIFHSSCTVEVKPQGLKAAIGLQMFTTIKDLICIKSFELHPDVVASGLCGHTIIYL